MGYFRYSIDDWVEITKSISMNSFLREIELQSVCKHFNRLIFPELFGLNWRCAFSSIEISNLFFSFNIKWTLFQTWSHGSLLFRMWIFLLPENALESSQFIFLDSSRFSFFWTANRCFILYLFWICEWFCSPGIQQHKKKLAIILFEWFFALQARHN